MIDRNSLAAWAFSLAALTLGSGAVAQQAGTVEFDVEFETDAVEWTPQYSVYLPPGYHTGSRLYPVIYLLPGGAGQSHRFYHKLNTHAYTLL